MLQKVLRQRIAALFVCVAGVLTAIPFAGTQASIQKGQSVTPQFNSVTRVPVGPGGVGANNLAVNSVTNRVYTSNNSSRNVTVLDGTTRAIITNIPVGVGPQGIAVNESTNRVYVANLFSGAISVIDGTTNTVLTSVAVEYPYKVAVNPVTNRIFVTKRDFASVSEVVVIDGFTNSVIGTVPTSSATRGIGVNPTTNLVYVACKTTGVTVFDGSSLAPVTTVSTLTDLEGIAVNPATNRIYVGYQYGRILVIDGSTQTVSATLQSGQIIGNIAVNPTTNRVYVSRPNDANSVLLLDGATNAILTSLSLPCEGVAVNPLNNQVFVSSAGLVIQVDGNTNSEIGRAVIGNSLGGMTVHPILGRAYIFNQSARSISVVEGRTGTILATLPMPNNAGPTSVSVNPLTNLLYVGTIAETYVFDCITNQLVTVIPPTGLNLANVVVNPITNRLYTSNRLNPSLSVIDCSSHTLLTNIFLLFGGSVNKVVVNPVTNRIYVMRGAVVEVVDGYSNTRISSIFPANQGSFINMAVNPKTDLLYFLTNASPYVVAVVDGRSGALVATIPVSPLPAKIEVNPDNNRVYVVHNLGGLITSIDGTTNTVLETNVYGLGPVDVAVDPFTSQVYVPNAGDDTLTIFDEGETNPKHPKVLFFTPNIGMAGTAITILGKNFGTTTSVTLNGQPISFSVQSANQLNLVIPPGARTGQLVVTNLTGSVNAGVFTVIRQK